MGLDASNNTRIGGVAELAIRQSSCLKATPPSLAYTLVGIQATSNLPCNYPSETSILQNSLLLNFCRQHVSSGPEEFYKHGQSTPARLKLFSNFKWSQMLPSTHLEISICKFYLLGVGVLGSVFLQEHKPTTVLGCEVLPGRSTGRKAFPSNQTT